MCVIIACKTRRPSLELLRAAHTANPDGGGVAWLDAKRVRWQKGVGPRRIHELTEQVPLPFVVHFRIGTVGGKTGALCHPFPVERAARTDLAGVTKRVLFHNGHWGEWEEVCARLRQRHGLERPAGEWSDTRALAWAAAVFGTRALDLIGGQKIVTLGPEGLSLYGRGWTSEGGMWLSNTYHRIPAWTEAVADADEPRGRTGSLFDDVRGPSMKEMAGLEYKWVNYGGQMVRVGRRSWPQDS